MTAPEPSNAPDRPVPWLPLTFRGVSTFAWASWSRCFAFWGGVGLWVGFTTLWWFHGSVAPVIREAIVQSPVEAEIREGTLQWPTGDPARLAENRFLAIVVQPAEDGDPGQTADFQIELEATGLTIRSLLGAATYPYPKDRILPLGRSEMEPKWGAWEPMLRAGLVASLTVLVLGLSLLLGLLYLPAVRILVAYGRRDASWPACWRLAGTACVPGFVLLGLGMALYQLHRLELPALIFLILLQLPMCWTYLLLAPWYLPKHPSTGFNPFRGASK